MSKPFTVYRLPYTVHRPPLRPMYAYETKIRVRYGETDQMGYLYYGHYAQYFEVGRVGDAICSLGLTYKELEEVHGIWLPVVSLEMRFVRPAHYDESVDRSLRDPGTAG